MTAPSVLGAPHKTLVLGASPNPSRYAYLATLMLRERGHEVVALGLKPGRVGDVEIETDKQAVENQGIHTVTLYVGADRQQPFEDWLVALRPRRVIFNPGTENPALIRRLADAGVEPVVACTLVMLRTHQY